MLRVRSAPCLRGPFLAPTRPSTDDSGRAVPCRAAAVASLLLQLPPHLQDVGHSIKEELVVQSALHVSTLQRLECVQRLGAKVTQPEAPGYADRECGHGVLELLSPASFSGNDEDEDDAEADLDREAAMCYATPPDLSDDDEDLRLRSGMRAAATPGRLAVCRSAASESSLELDLLQQRALTALELLTSETSQAARRARHRRRRHLVSMRSLLRSLRSSISVSADGRDAHETRGTNSLDLAGLLGNLKW